MQDKELATYPAKGSRRKLDEAWLDLLHQDGITGFFPDRTPSPPGLGRAIEEFNQRQYWQCHETLEAIWLPERYPLRLFYHGLIKAAVGLLHLQRRNQHGATAKLSDAEYTLEPFLPDFMGIKTGQLREELENRLEYLKPDSLVDWDAIEALPPVQIHLQKASF